MQIGPAGPFCISVLGKCDGVRHPEDTDVSL